MNPSKKPRVAVVFGGKSSEHAISCVTAGSVMAAIDREKYEVVPVGIAKDGRWVLESADPTRWQINSRDVLPAVDPQAAGISLVSSGSATDLVVTPVDGPPGNLGQVNVVFPVLHGPWGEDGTIQGLLEMAGVRYVGAGVLASAVSMDKHFMKVVLQSAGLPVMDWVTLNEAAWVADPNSCTAQVEATLEYPIFAKPCRGGSSMGISKIHDRSEFADAMAQALAHDPRVLLEAAAVGAREVECGVLAQPTGLAQASVVAEIRIGDDHEFYDFAAKYLPGESTQLDVPASLPSEVAEQIQRLALLAFEAVSCEGLARVDFFLLPDGKLVINELNTMPGFTPTSMFPLMWGASGLSYGDVVDRLLSVALGRGTGLR